MYQESNNNGMMTGFIMGAVVGLTLGLMLAPKPGRYTRELVRQGIADGLELVRNYRENRSGEACSGSEPEQHRTV